MKKADIGGIEAHVDEHARRNVREAVEILGLKAVLAEIRTIAWENRRKLGDAWDRVYHHMDTTLDGMPEDAG